MCGSSEQMNVGHWSQKKRADLSEINELIPG